MNSIVAPAVMLGFLWVWLSLSFWYLGPRGKLTSITLLPYQRGVLYKKVYPVHDVGPWKHRVWAGTELLVHGDVRPITVNYERLIVGLKDGLGALYGFSASVQVDDMRKAIYSARDYTNVPAAVFLCCARRHLSSCSGKTLGLEKDAVANGIAEDAKARLGKAGFSLISFRLTQLAVGTPQPPAPKAGPSAAV
jgi:hypothetical protein